jgi:hypothetical protein
VTYSLQCTDAGPYAALTADSRRELRRWLDEIGPISKMRQGVGAAVAGAASRLGVSPSTVRRKLDAYRRSGDWRDLVDRRSSRADDGGIPKQLVELWRFLCEQNKRKCKPAYRALLRMWADRDPSIGEIPEYASFPGWPRIPEGWSYRNLIRLRPTDFELRVSRVGRAAAADLRPQVLTTRRGVPVGAYFMFDDLWHDMEVAVLDTRRRGRPLEFCAIDLASASKIAWGCKVRTKDDDGKASGLNESQFRFLLAMVFSRHGYHPAGTVLAVEHGTAAIREDLERDLSDATGGRVTVSRGGISGAPATDAQFFGRGRGNFRFKAALESLHSLVHNELAALPGQTGSNSRLNEPEEMHGRRRQADALFAAMRAISPERALALRLPVVEFRQFLSALDMVYARINARTEHELEGWDDNTAIDYGTGLARRLSPSEVWDTGRRAMVSAPEALVAVILAREATERTVRKNRIEICDKSIASDALVFDPTRLLRDGQGCAAALNPFDPSKIFIYDARGRFIGSAPRVHAPCRTDLEAVHREMGRAAQTEALLLQDARRRALPLARARAEDSRHNARALDLSKPFTDAERRIADRVDGVISGDIDDMLSPSTSGSFDTVSAPDRGGEISEHETPEEDLIDSIL